MMSRIKKRVKNRSRDLNRVMVIIVIQAVFVLAYVAFLTWTFKSDSQLLYVGDQLSIWRLISYLTPVVIGPPLIFILLKSLVYRHIGAPTINFRTYIDNQFYGDFVRFSSKHRINDRDFWVLMAKNNFGDAQKLDIPEANDHNQVLIKEEEATKQSVMDEEILSDLPDFNPNGPNPFK